MRIVLIGFMGSGKSSIARKLTAKLNYELLEVDELIVENSEFDSIPEIFSKKGEEHFRDLESATLESISSKDNVVVSCGGGVIGRSSNRDYIKTDSSTVIFLDASFETAKSRIRDVSKRPLFQDESKAKDLYNSRLKIYEEFSDIKIVTDNKDKNQVAEEIIKKLGL